ncbi:polysaccharide_lyase 8 family protein [Hexamita inflata]|uniref:Polysaccharide lyase 8 family protein n=1 Tax=Hexamita inflata TaxID=28002 RepID=A0AA86V6C2_9EUKA|nr:polysaccharide lyase 8 family protein [Hexamita inflata]
MLDISQILLNKQNVLTENIYSKISYKQAITIRQNKATQLINEMNTTNERTYLWSSQPLLQQGPQLLETVKNIQVIATAYAVTPFENYTNLHYKNLTTLNIVQSALDFILQNYYKADLIKLSPPVSGKVQNWWEWQIAIPDVLNNIVVLIKDDISQNILNSFLASSKRFLPSPTICGNLSGSSCPQALVSTGGNLVNTAQIGFIRGLLSQNITESDISFHALDHIFDFVSESDGFYKDYSFIQHYSIPSSANYGQVVFFGLTNLIVILNESTMYNYSQSSISKIFDFIINGETTLIYNCQMMNMVNGRSISLLEQEYINCKFVISYVAVLSQYTQSSEQSEYMKRIVKHHITKAQPLIDITLLYQQAGIIMTKIRANTHQSQPHFPNFYTNVSPQWQEQYIAEKTMPLRQPCIHIRWVITSQLMAKTFTDGTQATEWSTCTLIISSSTSISSLRWTRIYCKEQQNLQCVVTTAPSTE